MTRGGNLRAIDREAGYPGGHGEAAIPSGASLHACSVVSIVSVGGSEVFVTFWSPGGHLEWLMASASR